MHITVKADELSKKLSLIQGIAGKNETMPILAHCLLRASRNKSDITTTNLETTIRETIALTIKEEGEICIPVKKLSEITKEIEGDITLTTADSWLKIKAGKSLFKIACLSAENFPQFPIIESGNELKLKTLVLSEILNRTIYAAGENDKRYVLNSLLFDIKAKGELAIAGTDGHRLAVFKSPAPTTEKDVKLIISKKALSELKKLLTKENEQILMIINSNHVLYKVNGTEMASRLIDGTYPNYEAIIPQENPNKVTADRNELIKALKRISIISKEKTNAVKVTIENNKLTFSASNPDLGEATEEITVEYLGNKIETAFNASYLIDALSVMATEKAVIKFNENLSPATLHEENYYTAVVMPMRI